MSTSDSVTSMRRRSAPLAAGWPEALTAFLQRRGRPKNERRRPFAARRDESGLYATRHESRSWCSAAGLGSFTMAPRMGTSVRTIDDIYGHPITDSIERETARLDDYDNPI